MGKHTQTKNKILNMLKNKNMTIVELNEKLGLSRATIRQHIADLQILGLVEEIPNKYFRKHVTYKAKSLIGKTTFKAAKEHWKKGNTFFEERNLEEAIIEYNEALKIDGKYADAYFNKALTEYMMEMLEATEKDLKKVLQIQPESPDATILMGDVEKKKSDLAKAKYWYEKALKYHPNYYFAKDRLKEL